MCRTCLGGARTKAAIEFVLATGGKSSSRLLKACFFSIPYLFIYLFIHFLRKYIHMSAFLLDDVGTGALFQRNLR